MNEKITFSWVEVELAKVNMTIEKWPDIIYYSADNRKYRQLLELAKEKRCRRMSKKLGWVFHHEPVQSLVNLLNEEFSGFEANIYYTLIENDAFGLTVFPDDGSTPEIYINVNKNKDFESILDILAHEAANVIAGKNDDHSTDWNKIYESIFEKYMSYMNRVAGNSDDFSMRRKRHDA